MIPKLDVRFGHPDFLAPYWEKHPVATNFSDDRDQMRYQINAGTPALKTAILETHKTLKNAQVDGKHLVIGNGATQILIAALRAYGERGAEWGYAKTPFFFRFVHFFTLAGLTQPGLDKTPADVFGPTVEIVTVPNNPTGVFQGPDRMSVFQVYDHCYNWPQYTNHLPYNGDVMVFSLAKATGHASTRMGWALVKDRKIAESMMEYVEHSSSGVSIEAQHRATDLLQSEATRASIGLETSFTYGTKVLAKRWLALRQLASDKFNIENSTGMFAWVRVPGHVGVNFFEEHGILGADGALCGGTHEHVRLNIGCPDHVFELLLARLSTI